MSPPTGTGRVPPLGDFELESMAEHFFGYEGATRQSHSRFGGRTMEKDTVCGADRQKTKGFALAT